MRELKMDPSKWEMVRALSDWITEKSDIEHATFDALDRLTILDLKLIMLAIGYKLDQREIASLRRHFQIQWEHRHGKRAERVIDMKAITDDTA